MDKHTSQSHFLNNTPEGITGDTVEFVTPAQEQLEKLRSQVAAHRATIESFWNDIGEAATDKIIGELVEEYSTAPEHDDRAIEDAMLAGTVMLESAQADGGDLNTATAINHVCDTDIAICSTSLTDAELGGVDMKAVAQKLDENKVQSAEITSAAGVEEVRAAILAAGDRLYPDGCIWGANEQIKAVSQELSQAINQLPDASDRASLVKEVATLGFKESGGLSSNFTAVTKEFLTAVLQGDNKQEAVLDAWVDASMYPQESESLYKKGRIFNTLLISDLPLDKEGVEYVRNGVREFCGDNIRLNLCFDYLVTSETIKEFNPVAKELLIDMMIGVHSTEAAPLMCHMDIDQQRQYLEGVARKAQEGGVQYVEVFNKIDPAALKPSIDELQSIAESSGYIEMMLSLGARGVEGVDAMRWVSSSMKEAAACRDYLQRKYVEGVVQSMDMRKHREEVSKEQYQEFIQAMYHAALENQMYGAITTGIELGSEDSSGEFRSYGRYTDLRQRSPFLEAMAAAGDSYVDLYRERCRKMVREDAGQFGYESVVHLVTWAGGVDERSMAGRPVVDTELARQLLDVGIEELRTDAVEAILDSAGEDDNNSSGNSLTELSALDMTSDQLIQHIVKKGRAIDLVSSIERYPCVDRWVSQGGLSDVMEMLGSDRLLKKDFGRIVQALDAHREAFADTVMSDKAKALQRLLRQTQQIMSAGATREGFFAVCHLQGGELPDDLREIGITHTGSLGVEQLRLAMAEMTHEIQQINPSDKIVESAQCSALYRSLLANQYRVGDVQFGRGDDLAMDDILQRYQAASSEIKAMRSEFTPETFKIKKADSYTGEVELTIDTRERIEALSTDMQIAAAQDGEQAIIHELVAVLADQQGRLADDIQAIDTGADEQYARLGEKAQYFYRRNAEDRLAGIQQTQEMLQSGEYAFTDLFEQLHAVESCNTSLRRLAMVESLQHLGDEYKTELLAIRPDTASVAEVRVMKEFTEGLQKAHIFKNKKAKKAYNAMMSPGAFKDQLERYARDQLRAQEMTISFIPTRGIGMDLSGYVGDACWANIDESIAQANPNITAVIMKRQFDSGQQDRLIGSMIMIETEDEDGRDVLVMRGINPIENQINKMNPDSFLDAAESYCRGVAASMGYEPAIVRSECVGEAATNRPALFNVMERRYENYADTNITDPKATFNGYELNGVVKSLAAKE